MRRFGGQRWSASGLHWHSVLFTLGTSFPPPPPPPRPSLPVRQLYNTTLELYDSKMLLVNSRVELYDGSTLSVGPKRGGGGGGEERIRKQ